MKKHTDPMQPETYYHVYNRGINGCRLFTKRGNTDYFLEKYKKYLLPVVDTFAFVLMGNHFHFMVKTKSETEVVAFYKAYKMEQAAAKGKVYDTDKLPPFYSMIANQFGKLFNSYALSINKQDKRTGGLLEESFRRIPIETDTYALNLVYYIHYNPKKLGFVADFRDYSHSSYHSFCDETNDFIQKETVFEWFGGKQNFFAYHSAPHDLDDEWQKKNWVEVD
jgi:putative transposase